MNPITYPELIGMTDRQAQRIELLARIDELDRLMEITRDPETIKLIKDRKKALRDTLNTL